MRSCLRSHTKAIHFNFNSVTRTKLKRFTFLVSVCFECGNDYQGSREQWGKEINMFTFWDFETQLHHKLCNKRMCREQWTWKLWFWSRFIEVFHFNPVKTACTSNDLVQISSQCSCVILIPKWCPRNNFLQTWNWH